MASVVGLTCLLFPALSPDGRGRLEGALFFFFLKHISIFIYLAAAAISCDMQTLSCDMWDLVP